MHSQRHVDQDSPLDSLPLHHAFSHEQSKEFCSLPFPFSKPQSLKHSPQLATAPHPMKFEELASKEHLHGPSSYLTAYGSQSALAPPNSASVFSAQASNYSLASAFPFAFGYSCPRWPTSMPPPLLSPQAFSSSSSLDGTRSFCPTASPSSWSNSHGLSSPSTALDSTLHSPNDWALYYSGYANALYRSAAAAGNASSSSLALLADRASAAIPSSSHASVSSSYPLPSSLSALHSSRDPIALFQSTTNVSAF